MSKRYDRAYFDRWYRDPRQRVKHADELRRKVQLAVSLAEYYLNRPLESVIDIGCGEGAWHGPLLALRPKLRYIGFDSSEYVVERYGNSRNIHYARFDQLDGIGLREPVDLLICSDVMHYVPSAHLLAGVPQFARLCHGVAFLEAFCRGDDFVGDDDGFVARTATWYRKLFARHGWISAGSNCYLSRDLRDWASRLELA